MPKPIATAREITCLCMMVPFQWREVAAPYQRNRIPCVVSAVRQSLSEHDYKTPAAHLQSLSSNVSRNAPQKAAEPVSVRVNVTRADPPAGARETSPVASSYVTFSGVPG